MMSKETPEQSKIILRSFKMGLALWRNNSGVAREEHRYVRYGLGNDSERINKAWKSGDLIGIGWSGRFLMVEVKRPGWNYTGSDRELAQANCINDVNQRGGIAFFCTSADEFQRMMEGLKP